VSLWSKIKNKLNINRKYLSGQEDLWVNGEKVDFKGFTLEENKHYVFHKHIGKFQTTANFKLTYYWKKNGSKRATTIYTPLGFLWDGASIPKTLQGLIGGKFDPEFIFASMIHDKAVKMGLDHYPESRIFYEILKTRQGHLNIPWWQEKAMYLAVYGWSLYSS